MPPGTNADVLRRHGLMVLADWAENALIAPSVRAPVAVLGVRALGTRVPRVPRVRRVANGRRARVRVRGRGRGRAARGRPALPLPFIWRRCCCRFPQYSQEFATAGASGNAATCGNAAEPLHHWGSFKGPFCVDWHSQMPLRGCFLDRASPNPTSGLPFPFRITSMSFTGRHGV